MKERQKIKEANLRFLMRLSLQLHKDVRVFMDHQFRKTSKDCAHAIEFSDSRRLCICDKATKDSFNNPGGFAVYCRFDTCPFT